MFARKSAMALLSTLLTVSLLAGCGGQKPTEQAPASPPVKEEEKRLTLYTSFGADLYNVLTEAFEKDTGIKVDVVFAGTGEMLKRIEAEKATPQGDVMLGGGAESYEAYQALFDAYKIKEDAAIPAALKSKDNIWYGFNALPMVIMYNKNLVKEDQKPTGWKDLADPKWKGKLAMADANKSGTSFVQVVTMLTLFGREDGKGWTQVQNVVKNAKVLGSSSLPPKGANDGEYALALTHENAVWKYMKAGGPVDMVYPVEGTATIPDSVAVIKGAQHPQNARKFVDWLFTKETQTLASTKMGLRPARADVAPPDGLVALDKIKLVQLDMAWVSGKRQEILNQWQDTLTK